MLSVGSRQLTFVFADSPVGGEDAIGLGVPEWKAYLLHQAKVKEAYDPIAHTRRHPPSWASASLRQRLEEPDVWSTSPVLWEAWGSNPPGLPDGRFMPERKAERRASAGHSSR